MSRKHSYFQCCSLLPSPKERLAVRKMGRPGLAVTSITLVKRTIVVPANFLKLLRSIQSSQCVGLWLGPITFQRCDCVQVSLLF